MSEIGKADNATSESSRRDLMKRLGRFAVVTPPAVTLILAAGQKPARAQPVSPVGASSRQLKVAGGPLRPEAMLADLAGYTAPHGLNSIDAVGLCLGSIQAVSARVARLERQLAASRS